MSQRLNDRVERRLRIVSAGRRSQAGALAASRKLTYSHNVSVHGTRIVSNHSWQIGEHPDIATLECARWGASRVGLLPESRQTALGLAQISGAGQVAPLDSASHDLKQRLGES